MLYRSCVIAVLVLLCSWAGHAGKVETGESGDGPGAGSKVLPVLAAPRLRQVVSTINVTNGGKWGTWRFDSFCPHLTYAYAFDLKVQPEQGVIFDDSALNAFWLKCAYRNGTEAKGDVTSDMGPWGNWTGQKRCMKAAGVPYFLTRFRLQVEPEATDNTAANNVIFHCRSLEKDTNSYELEGIGGPWGNYAADSKACPVGAAICGLNVKIEEPQGIFGDETALNDVVFYCCDYR